MSEYRFSSAEVVDELAELKRLPSFSDILVRYDALINHPKGAHISEVVELISLDPRMAAGILNVVNSARYSSGFVIEDLSQAIARLGVSDIRVMMVALNFKSMVYESVAIDKEAFLSHGLVSAFVAKQLASKFKIEAESAFMMGLLHEVGLYILATFHHDAFIKMKAQTMGKQTRLIATEREVYGVDHASVSARMIQHWHFSKEVVMGVLGHHAPIRLDREYQKFGYLTQLAEKGANYLGYYNGLVTQEPNCLSDTAKAALNRIDLSEEAYIQALQAAQVEAQQTGFI